MDAYNFMVQISEWQSRFLCKKLKQMTRDLGILSIREAGENLYSKWCPNRNRARRVASSPMPHFGPANIPNSHQQSLTPHEACFEDDCDRYWSLLSIYKIYTLKFSSNQRTKLSGAAEARRAHNPEDTGSKPVSARECYFFLRSFCHSNTTPSKLLHLYKVGM